MYKKILIVSLALLLMFSCCACDNFSAVNTDSDVPSTEAVTQTPEELAEDFLRAMYLGDLDAFFAHIPEFTYDTLLYGLNLEVPEGEDKGTVIYNYFKSAMEEEPEDRASKVTIETKISDTLTKQSYLDAVNKYYIPEGVVSEKDIEKIQDAVFVAFNAHVKFGGNQNDLNLTDFKSALPCVKIDGKWYVDYIYLLMIPVSSAKPEPVQ